MFASPVIVGAAVVVVVVIAATVAVVAGSIDGSAYSAIVGGALGIGGGAGAHAAGVKQGTP